MENVLEMFCQVKMSVIIRLQNLPWSANALDIRQYFTGLSIPEGGVHIVGGEQGDAFIAFSTDEDARQAFLRNNGRIKEVQITLSLSSRTEMQRVIEAARSASYAAFMQPQATVPMPAAVPSIIPAAIPELTKKDDKEKSDRRDRKRSRSRERRDRSRDRDRRDRRHRDRSRSRSRERRRRRDRSRSRDRSKSKERDRKSRDRKRTATESRATNGGGEDKKKVIEPWSNEIKPLMQPGSLLGGFANNLEELNRLQQRLSGNDFSANNLLNNAARGRSSWPPATTIGNNSNDFAAPNPNSRNEDDDIMEARREIYRTGPNPEVENRGGRPKRIHPNCCVKLEPFYGSYGDVRRFFSGCFISNSGIKFVNDVCGVRTGVVYVQFGLPQGKNDALLKNNELLNGVNVSVSHITDDVFEEAVDRFVPDDDPRNRQFKGRGVGSRNITKYFGKQEDELQNYTCLTVDDLPSYVKEQDILKMFSLYPLTSLLLTAKGRGGHIAYVKFSSADDAKKAYEENSQHFVEGKAVTVNPCKDEDFEKINKLHEVDVSPPQRKLDTDCLELKNLPLKTNDRDIADFFSDIGVIPFKIHLISNNLGFTGQAFCEFSSMEDAERAVKKDGANLANAVISVRPIPKEEMMNILGHTLPQLPTEQPALSPDSQLGGPNPQPNHQFPNDLPEELPPNPQFREPFQMGFPRPRMMRPYFGRGFEGPRGRFMGPRGPMRHRFGNFGLNHEFQEETPPGCTVYMDNVPYKAGTNDILDFFDGYNVTDNVSRRFNPNNTPSAEAKVVFPSPEEAYRAVQDLHMKKLWERPIYLKQV